MNQPIEKTEETAKRPDDFLTVKVRMPDSDTFEEKELFMSAGLVRTLVGISQLTSEDTTQLFTNPQVQEMFLIHVLAPRSKKGQPVAEYSSEDFGIGTEDGQKVVDWAIDHVLYFFTSAVQNLEKAVTKDGGNLKLLTDSLNGLASSVEKKPSAGPSTADQAA